MSKLQSATLPTVSCESSILDSVISETLNPSPESILDKVLEATENPSKTVPVITPEKKETPKPTQEQKAEAKTLREIAKQLGGLPALIAGLNITPTYTDAENYINCLKMAITTFQVKETPKPQTVEQPKTPKKTGGVFKEYCKPTGRKGTAKQWKYIAHLKSQLLKVGEGWANNMANTIIPNCVRNAMFFIKDMINALKRRYESTKPKTSTGGRICSVCWTPGCNIGPMVSR